MQVPADAVKRILMIAFHFPPLAGSSGIQRTLRFVQHLPNLGWEPLVLSADPRAYERTSDDLQSDIPERTVVHRAFALDTSRHLSWKGRYVAAMARPDRWISWKYDAVRQGLKMIERYRPKAIWSTYPVATAHVIAAELQRRTGLPWIADFRDPMGQDNFPDDPITRAQFFEIEKRVVKQASSILFTTPGAARVYQQRYPAYADRIQVLENGYDESSFRQAEAEIAGGYASLNPGCFTLLHSGIVYPAERDPTQLFQALERLNKSYPEVAGNLKIRFRASVHDDLLNQLAGSLGISALIETMPAIGYREALSEMMRADGLLIMQAANCNDQIPAKIYEYLRAGKPILGLTDHAGDTANLLRTAGSAPIADLASVDEIYEKLILIAKGRAATVFQLADTAAVRGASREGRTAALVNILDTVLRQKL